MVAGIPFGNAVFAPVIAVTTGTFLMGLYANRP
jgi:xanthine/uracil/vitamin C permease (AzgA family)